MYVGGNIRSEPHAYPQNKRDRGKHREGERQQRVEKLLDPTAGRVPRLPEVTSSAYPTP